jgi:uncharacterized protein (DUF58 family)
MAGRTGELLGRGTGSSLEFQEYREYMPGDDIRHLDWSAFGRSDQLMIRLFREEISPRTEILLDGSRSMTTGGAAKPRLAKQVAAMFGLMAGLLGGRPALFLVDDRSPLETLTIEGLDRLERYSFEGTRDLGAAAVSGAVPFKKQSIRIVISDFLFPHDPAALVRRLASEAAALWVIQILNEFERDPAPLGGRRLVDAETEQESDLIINPQRITEYRTRLARLQSELGQACRRAHALFVTVAAEKSLMHVCHEDFCQAGLLRVD